MDIIYEDKDIIVINKPAGMLVHGQGKNLVSLLIKYYPAIKEVGEKDRPGIVHRLDKDTSGLLMVAKNNKAYQYLVDQFKQRKIIKKYIALVYDKIKEKEGTIVYRIKKKGPKSYLVWQGKEAETKYKVLRYLDNFTLLEVQPKTGRSHQIRIHFHKLNHPIVGDKIYGARKRKHLPFFLKRHFLHAYYLKIKLPCGVIKEFKIDLPKDLKEVLKNYEER